MYKLGDQSKKRLIGVHPELVAVVKRAMEVTKQDFMVLEGVRTKDRQKELYAQGRTKPGKIVTWTMQSNHIPKDDGYGHAVDIVPYPLDWNTPSKFDAIAKAMLQAGQELHTPVRWGADWNRNGTPREKGETDSPHWEI